MKVLGFRIKMLSLQHEKLEKWQKKPKIRLEKLHFCDRKGWKSSIIQILNGWKKYYAYA